MSRIARTAYEFLLRRLAAVWLGVGAPVLLVLIAHALPVSGGISDDERTVIAASLEFAGLVLIAIGYVQLREQFGRLGILASLKQYFVDFWNALKPGSVQSLNAEAGASVAMGGRARLTLRAGPNATIERRLEIVEGRVEALDKELQAVSDRVDKEGAALRAAVERAKADVDREVRALRTLIEHASIGDAGSEVIGWLWLLSGILVSSWSSWGQVLRAAP